MKSVFSYECPLLPPAPFYLWMPFNRCLCFIDTRVAPPQQAWRKEENIMLSADGDTAETVVENWYRNSHPHAATSWCQWIFLPKVSIPGISHTTQNVKQWGNHRQRTLSASKQINTLLLDFKIWPGEITLTWVYLFFLTFLANPQVCSTDIIHIVHLVSIWPLG